MKNIFKKQLFSVTNKAGHHKLIIALNEADAANLVLAHGFVKNINNLKIKNISEEYITQERLDKGLNFDLLEDGFFGALFKANKTSWSTYK